MFTQSPFKRKLTSRWARHHARSILRQGHKGRCTCSSHRNMPGQGSFPCYSKDPKPRAPLQLLHNHLQVSPTLAICRNLSLCYIDSPIFGIHVQATQHGHCVGTQHSNLVKISQKLEKKREHMDTRSNLVKKFTKLEKKMGTQGYVGLSD